MGFATVLEPRFRPSAPDTPPEVLTPDSASFPSRRSEDRSWNHPRAPPSPPMSNYEPAARANDMPLSSSGKEKEASPARSELMTEQPAPPRQQLPPLSSLFGPPSQIPPPPHPPVSDRQAPYPASSPLEPPLRPPIASSSYFPSPASQPPRSLLDSRLHDRPQIPPLSRVFPGPLSPVPRQEQRQDGRPDYASSTSQWSAQHESNREYSLGSRDSQYYQPSPDRYSSHLPSRDDGRRSDYRDSAPQAPASHNAPSTPTSSAGVEVPPTKDGLGPKIWTGTHFLPRFVRAAEVPGEGMCYFYDDGSHCKTVIDGEAVNAHWGVTKAGKPRKRLAIACVTCREKKIKCDPDYPRCLQCEKFGRVCKFKNAPRGGHNNHNASNSTRATTSPATPPAEPDDLRRLPRLPPADLSAGPRPGNHSGESVSPRTMLRPASPTDSSLASSYPPRKQARVGYDHHSPLSGRRSPLLPPPPPLPAPTLPNDAPQPPAASSFAWRSPAEVPVLPRIHDDVLRRTWQPDSRPDARV
ncbi:hypothetical protein VTJ83DRAFT_5780 [Remersonia thermophila]|uniref:Zn(2)-C6 fungal-type domain-containing protein n=1 Tax=Remersonia thermophila TaxID=72144 RepID=A0ABR4D7X6_9PEZI